MILTNCILNLLVTVVFLALFFGGEIQIKTKKVIVVDDNGVERIHLDPASKDVRVLGKVFQRREAASGLILFNDKGDENGGFVVMDDGTASITIDSYADGKVSERVSMYVLNGDKAGFLIKDIDNNIRLRSQLNADDSLNIQVFDKDEKELKSLAF